MYYIKYISSRGLTHGKTGLDRGSEEPPAPLASDDLIYYITVLSFIHEIGLGNIETWGPIEIPSLRPHEHIIRLCTFQHTDVAVSVSLARPGLTLM